MTPVHGANGTATSSRASSTVVMNQKERINGWSCPWHPLQFVAWFFLFAFSVSHFGVFVFYLPKEWQAAGIIIPGGICAIHIIYHLMALTFDPADPNIRGGTKKTKAIFDRSQHQHVIENCHCYICQADVGPKSKHCSVCNKCVSDFDHHCKWLNNCVGGQNYRLFIGCIASAFVLALLVFAITLYIFIMYFVDRDSLKSLTGGQFKVFVPITSDVAFVTYAGVVVALLLLSIALLGHLLGFHIYLMCHKISTYEFIVSSRDSRPNLSDVKAGSKSPASRKLFKNKVKPEEDRRESVEPVRFEISDNGRSEGSEDTLPNETTVKFISEVSSKAAAKQHKSSTEQEPSQSQDSPSKQPSVIKGYSPQGITEPASSEESLKEITPTTPRIVIQQPASGGMASTLERHAGIPIDQSSVNTSSARPGPSGVTFEDDGEELVPSPRKKKKRKVRVDEGLNTGTGNIEECELVEVVTKGSTQGHVNNGQDNVDAAIPRKKKKKKAKSSAPESLPPVITRPARRPLPPLQLED
ncbi:uncharacterized protein LOC144649135 [Oculina patagonica]